MTEWWQGIKHPNRKIGESPAQLPLDNQQKEQTMGKAKYVVLGDARYPEYFTPVVFDETMGHAFFPKEEVVAAGFVEFDEAGKPCCYGKSESLGVKSRGDEDSKLIMRRILRW